MAETKAKAEYVPQPEDFVLAPAEMKSSSAVEAVGGVKHETLKRFFAQKSAVAGVVILGILILLAIIGPSMNEHTYKSITHGHECLVPRIPGLEKIGIANGYFKGTNQYASKGLDDVYYWFGSDTQGRDIFTRVWAGTRVSLVIAFAAVLVDIFIFGPGIFFS